MPVLLIIIAVLTVGGLAGLFAVYYKTFYSPHKRDSLTETPPMISKHPYREEARRLVSEICALPCEFITTRSYDGLTLSARYYKGDPEKPLCICFHGYHGSPVRDFSGGGLFLIKEGYSVILVDHRAHWNSGGHTITYGIRERYDVRSWVEYAVGRFGDIPIYLFGISMGAATVLMASGLELPANVRAICADCPYSSPKEIIKYVCTKIHLNPELSWPLIKASAFIFGRLNIDETTAAKEVVKTKVPIMIIHGEADRFVPPSMSREVYDANPDMIEYHTFPEAGHGLSYLYDTERYQRLVREFLAKHK